MVSPLQLIRGSGSVVSSLAGVRSRAPAKNGFGTFQLERTRDGNKLFGVWVHVPCPFGYAIDGGPIAKTSEVTNLYMR